MISDLLEVGDRVTIVIPKENREWGYNPCPDGTEAEVISFDEIAYGRVDNYGREPGIYENKSWSTLQLLDGSRQHEYSSRLSLLDRDEQKRREKEFKDWRKTNEDTAFFREKKKLRNLPETKFCEWDQVRVCGRHVRSFPAEYTIFRIDYMAIVNDRRRNDGSPWPVYMISADHSGGWTSDLEESDLELVSRGLVWHYYQGRKPTFERLPDEAEFYYRLGHTCEVRNPANKLYKWEKDEVLEAIRQGLVHGFSLHAGFFGSQPRICALRYSDEELGRRVAEATLQGFMEPIGK